MQSVLQSSSPDLLRAYGGGAWVTVVISSFKEGIQPAQQCKYRLRKYLFKLIKYER